MPHSQSHLISLATLLESAEARHSAMPPLPTSQKDDSGLIDILAMQRRAKEERANAAAAASRTPVPTVSPVRGVTTDPDFVAAMAAAQRKKKHVVLGAIAGCVVLLAIAIGVGVSGGEPPQASAAVVAPPVVAPPAPPPAPPPPVAAVEAPVVAPALAEPVAASAPVTTKKKAKGRKGSHASQSKGPKLTKIVSGGTAG